MGYLMGGVSQDSRNLVYNLADMVNKIAFCLAIWDCAKADTADKAALMRSMACSGLHCRLRSADT